MAAEYLDAMAKKGKRSHREVGRDAVARDIRRTLATGLQRLGIRLEVTEATLGHISGSRSDAA